MSGSMRLLDERHVATKVELMLWSNRMDLLALSNVRGEVALHRLSWQRVWSLPPPQDGSTVRAMAWRPDGKVIAIGYSTREVLLVDVENKETIHTTIMESDIISLKWVQEQDSSKNSSISSSHQERGRSSPNMLSQENASNFLPKLPSLSRSFGVNKLNNEENLEDTKRIRDQNHLNILLVGLVAGKVNISVFGLFPCGYIDLQPYMFEAGCESCGAILDAAVSTDLKVMFVIVVLEKKNKEDGGILGREVRLVILDTPMLASHSRELYTLALKQGHISSLQGYLSSTMQAITEAWESILLEMDSKLASYAATVADGSVSADFLDLLMLGVPSPELELFLQRDLTEKGLKKLSHSIELSYSNIQKLVLKHIHCVGTSLSFHLAELRGMARHVERYSPLGLREDTVAASLSAAGAFLVKATEVQQVIDHSMKKYKAFFRWLFLAILRLTDERVPPEITKGTQQDLSFIAEFLCNFDGFLDTNQRRSVDIKSDKSKSDDTESEASNGKVSDVPGSGCTSRKSRFNLERLGQYLVDQELTILPDVDTNPWNRLLEENPSAMEDSLIIPHFRKMSLVQQHRHLTTAIDAVFREPADCIGRAFTLQRVIRLPDSSLRLPLYYNPNEVSNKDHSRLFRVSSEYCGTDKKLVIAYPNTETSLHLIELPTHTQAADTQISLQLSCLCFNSSLSDIIDSAEYGADSNNHSAQLKVLGMQFYLPDILSLLLEKRGDDHSAVFVQFPRRVSRDIVITVPALPSSYREIPPADGSCLLEAGSLRSIDNFVASCLAVSGSRKVAVVLSENRCKVRLFEMEIEEEEEEDETMDARDSDQSHILDQSKSSDLDT